jgi:pteridine reductase
MTDSSPIALITGGAKRIGSTIARHLHAAGYNLVLHYRASHKEAEQLMQELNNLRSQSVMLVQADLDNHKAINEMATIALAQWQRLDLLVNNASTFYPTPVATATQEDWDQLFNSNLRGPYFLIQAVLDALKKSRGSIINIADIYADNPLKNHSLYCMAKAANVMMTKALALELAPEVRVNAIAPGAILWPETPNMDSNKILEKIPLQVTGHPGEIASMVLYLAKQTTYITGQVIKIDGGRSLQI